MNAAHRSTLLTLTFVFFATTTALSAADAPAPATTTTARDAKEIFQEIQSVQKELQKPGPFPSLANLATAESRAAFPASTKDLLIKLAALRDELSIDPPQLSMTPAGGVKAMLQGQRISNLAMADSLGSDAAAQQLAALALNSDKELAISGKMGQFLTAWILTDQDAAKQSKILDAVESVAKENPTSNSLATNLRTFLTPSLPKEFSQRIDDLYLKTLSGPVAAGMQAYLDAGAKERSALDKPLTLAGKTSDGKDFSTKAYAGKVILVDFWATWCGPCKAEIPKIKAVYEKYHDQGLEVIGVSCDSDLAALEAYTKDNNIPWPQFWDQETQAGKDHVLHPLAVEWKLNGIPQMFLIDRTGTLRSVEGREKIETLIPKYLEEKAAPTPEK